MITYNVIHLQQVNSTNTYLKELSRDTRIKEGTVILSDWQTEGKGRGDNTWLSEAGLNLTLSILLRPSLDANRHFFLNEFISIALVDVLKEYDISATIKWPNDVYIGDKKIAGILIENVLIADKIVTSIPGIGLNVNQLVFPPGLVNPISLSQLLNRTIDLAEVREKLLRSIREQYSCLSACEYKPMHEEYNSLLYRRGENIRYKVGGKISSGVLTEVNEEGELIIRTENNRYVNFLFGEAQIVI